MIKSSTFLAFSYHGLLVRSLFFKEIIFLICFENASYLDTNPLTHRWSLRPSSLSKLLPDDGKPLHDSEKYQRLAGKLNYLTVTQINITYPVNVVSQFISAPNNTHQDAAIQILRYLKGSPNKDSYILISDIVGL